QAGWDFGFRVDGRQARDALRTRRTWGCLEVDELRLRMNRVWNRERRIRRAADANSHRDPLQLRRVRTNPIPGSTVEPPGWCASILHGAKAEERRVGKECRWRVWAEW